MKKIAILSLLFLCLFVYKTMAQIQLDVDGDARIKGTLNVLLADNDSSVIIGPRAGERIIQNRLRNIQSTARFASEPENVFIGNDAGRFNNREGNTFVGPRAGENNNGFNNTFIGNQSARNAMGYENIAIGRGTNLEAIGNFNVSIGNAAFSSSTRNKANHSIFIGYNSGILGIDSVSNAIAIGANSKVRCSNCAVIGGASSERVNVGIGTQIPRAPLHTKRGFAGGISPLVGTEILIESDTQAFVSVMGPSDFVKGIAFGDPANGASGGVFYNSSASFPNSLTFKSGNRFNMVLTEDGRVGVGTVYPHMDATLHVAGRLRLGDYEFLEDGGNRMVALRGDFVPYNPNDLFDLGDSNKRWDVVYARNGMISTSDRREKKRIQKIGYGLKDIMRLRPVQYHWKNQPNDQAKLGLIAQEVQKVIKEVVVDHDYDKDENGNWVRQDFDVLGMYYVDLIPVLIKGMQEQQEIIGKQKENINKLKEIIEEQENRFDAIEKKLAELLNQKSETPDIEKLSLTRTSDTYLKQNMPNPFQGKTSIEYFIPQHIKKAALRISSIDGKVLKEQNIAGRTKGFVVIEADAFPAGTYVYTLILDGKVMHSKKMILAWK